MPKARWIAGATTLVCGALLAVLVGTRLKAKEQRAEAAPAAHAAGVGPASGPEPGGEDGSDFPVVEGRYQLASDWSMDLPGRFKRRVDEGDMYLWRPGLTLVIAIWNNAQPSQDAQLSALKAEISRDAYDLTEEADGALKRVAYRLHEAAEDQRQDAFYGFVVSKSSYVQLAVYFDDARELEAARRSWRSLADTTAPPPRR